MVKNLCPECFCILTCKVVTVVLKTRIFEMSAAYVSRFEAVFLCTHPKGPKMSFSSAAKYMKKSKTFVAKWVERYMELKNVDDLTEHSSSTPYTK